MSWSGWRFSGALRATLFGQKRDRRAVELHCRKPPIPFESASPWARPIHDRPGDCLRPRTAGEISPSAWLSAGNTANPWHNQRDTPGKVGRKNRVDGRCSSTGIPRPRNSPSMALGHSESPTLSAAIFRYYYQFCRGPGVSESGRRRAKRHSNYAVESRPTVRRLGTRVPRPILPP